MTKGSLQGNLGATKMEPILRVCEAEAGKRAGVRAHGRGNGGWAGGRAGRKEFDVWPPVLCGTNRKDVVRYVCMCIHAKVGAEPGCWMALVMSSTLSAATQWPLVRCTIHCTTSPSRNHEPAGPYELDMSADTGNFHLCDNLESVQFWKNRVG
jgi:hypothetical protein